MATPDQGHTPRTRSGNGRYVNSVGQQPRETDHEQAYDANR